MNTKKSAMLLKTKTNGTDRRKRKKKNTLADY